MTTDTTSPSMQIFPLTVALVILVVMTIYPGIATYSDGRADHVAALLLLSTMSAGFIRGVGFIPENKLLRGLFSTLSVGVFLLAALARLFNNGILSLPH